MKDHTRASRKKQVNFAVGMASLDGGRPSAYTKKLLERYEEGSITSRELRQKIMDKYRRDYE